jgi:hypothetical protein
VGANLFALSREALNKLIPFMVRQANHERTQQLTVRPELVEGFNQQFPKVARKYQIRQIFLG